MVRIFMLGWEFPPFLNGGLGVACKGLVEALAPVSDLRLVLPKSTGIRQPENWELIGLQGKELPTLTKTKESLVEEELKRVNVRYVEVAITGYERLERKQVPIEEEEILLLEKAVYEEEMMRPAGRFQLQELYGSDLLDRVMEYAELATEIGASQELDVIYAHDWMTFPAALELKARTGKPLVLHVHSLEYDRAGEESLGWIYHLEKHAMEQADLVFAVSQYTASLMESHYGIPTEKIRVIHNGIAPVLLYRRKAPFPQQLVVFLGRLTGQKGPEFFFDAACELLKTDREVRFVIAGKGELIESLILEAAEKGVGDRIHFTGFLEKDRVQDLLAMADVFVMPSVSEPFGLSALEAAQMGVPCIITENSGVGEVLPSALRVPHGEVKELQEMMTRLLDDEALRQSITQKQLMDLAGVSWHRAAESVLQAFQEGLGLDPAAV